MSRSTPRCCAPTCGRSCSTSTTSTRRAGTRCCTTPATRCTPWRSRPFAPAAVRLDRPRGSARGRPASTSPRPANGSGTCRASTSRRPSRQLHGTVTLIDEALPAAGRRAPARHSDPEAAAARTAVDRTPGLAARAARPDADPRSRASDGDLFRSQAGARARHRVRTRRAARAGRGRSRAHRRARSSPRPAGSPASPTPTQSTVRQVLTELARRRRDRRHDPRPVPGRPGRRPPSSCAAHDLVTVYDDPVDVIEMPEIDRGVAGAYCNPSGPLETDAAADPVRGLAHARGLVGANGSRRSTASTTSTCCTT